MTAKNEREKNGKRSKENKTKTKDAREKMYEKKSRKK